ncbi:MAG TPA: OsmC family protein [Actinomycetes bacterium]|jgi:putative redox protein|nr:OsmC family protein [Actinomycetes bacterium]
MPNLSVTHQSADRFELQVRGHRLTCDQPLADGGDDQGPTPTELFVGSLAACVAFYARRFLARHDLDAAGLRVEAAFTMSADRPARVDTITLRLLLPKPLAPNRRRALLAVVDHCTVHNSIRTPPKVRVTLAESAGTSRAPLATLGG